MDGQNGDGQIVDTKGIPFQVIEDTGDFEIMPCDGLFDFEDKERFMKLNLSQAQKMHIGGLLQQIPLAVSAGTMAQAYTVSFPKGLPHTLTALNQGGFGSMIQQNGEFIGTASFAPLSLQASFLGTFTAMSIASGQYFLSQINQELKMITLNLDRILEFLYGDKKAELMAEVSFVKYAYQNYGTIMEHEHQRVATLSSLQESKKVAMKDIEFYLGDLDSTVNSKDGADVVEVSGKAFQMKESLDFSLQLYVMSSLLEVYYSQNYDADYIRYVEKDISIYIDKCEKRILSDFSALGALINGGKKKMLKKVDTTSIEKQISKVMDVLNTGEESQIRRAFRSALYAREQKTVYYLTDEGGVYITQFL